jgi:hypothetical protein
VELDAATNLGLGSLGFITAGGSNQTLENISGNDTLVRLPQ